MIFIVREIHWHPSQILSDKLLQKIRSNPHNHLHAFLVLMRALPLTLPGNMKPEGLAWPDAPKAIQASREALDLAAHPDCGYAWGEADAAQA